MNGPYSILEKACTLLHSLGYTLSIEHMNKDWRDDKKSHMWAMPIDRGEQRITFTKSGQQVYENVELEQIYLGALSEITESELFQAIREKCPER